MELLSNCRLTNGHPTYPLFPSDVFKMVMVRQGLKQEIIFLRLNSTTDSRLFSCAVVCMQCIKLLSISGQ